MSYTLMVIYVASALCSVNPIAQPVTIGHYASQRLCDQASLKFQTPISDCQHLYCIPDK